MFKICPLSHSLNLSLFLFHLPPHSCEQNISHLSVVPVLSSVYFYGISEQDSTFRYILQHLNFSHKSPVLGKQNTSCFLVSVNLSADSNYGPQC